MGAEFECVTPLMGSGNTMDVQRMIATILSANGIRAGFRGYCHNPVRPGHDVEVETDGSVQGNSSLAGITWIPLEVKTRILQGMGEYQRIVPKTLEILRSLNCKVNTSTGHHLHVGFPEVDDDPTVIRSLYNLVHRFEPVIYSLVAPSRRNNNFCRPLPDVSKLLHDCRTLECFERNLSRFDRYNGLNWCHVFTHAPRLEFRYHGGTLDGEKAIHWARMCTQILNHAAARSCQASPKQVAGDKAGLEKFLTTLGFRVNTKIYSKVCPELRETGKWLLLHRWKELHPKASKSTTTGVVAAAATSNEGEV
jgi:hypothetical protein